MVPVILQGLKSQQSIQWKLIKSLKNRSKFPRNPIKKLDNLYFNIFIQLSISKKYYNKSFEILNVKKTIHFK
jgi:hypothetical protein